MREEIIPIIVAVISGLIIVIGFVWFTITEGIEQERISNCISEKCDNYLIQSERLKDEAMLEAWDFYSGKPREEIEKKWLKGETLKEIYDYCREDCKK